MKIRVTLNKSDIMEALVNHFKDEKIQIHQDDGLMVEVEGELVSLFDIADEFIIDV